MATKADMAKELEQLTGEKVNPKSHSSDDLEQMLREAKKQAAERAQEPKQQEGGAVEEANADDVPEPVQEQDEAPAEDAPAKDADPSEDDAQDNPPPDDDAADTVQVYLGDASPAGRLVFGRITVRRPRPNEEAADAAVNLPREQYEAYKDAFDLQEVQD